MDDIDVLNAIEDIRRLEARYARYADENRWQDLADLFTMDGTFTPLDVEGNVLVSMSGQAEIAATLGAVTSPET